MDGLEQLGVLLKTQYSKYGAPRMFIAKKSGEVRFFGAHGTLLNLVHLSRAAKKAYSELHTCENGLRP